MPPLCRSSLFVIGLMVAIGIQGFSQIFDTVDTVILRQGIEPALVVRPFSPSTLFVTSTSPAPVHFQWSFSTDGGTHWAGSEEAPPGIIDGFSSPRPAFSNSGRAYFSLLGSPGGVYVVSTTNLGATWSARSNADPQNSTLNDVPSVVAGLSNTDQNNLYAAWTDFSVSNGMVVFTRSTDNGTAWGTRRTLGIGSARGQGVHIAPGLATEVYVAWAHYDAGTAEAGIGFAASTNSGATFTNPVVAFPISGLRTSNSGVAEFNNTRVNSFPSVAVDRSPGTRNGWIYVTYPDRSTGDADIYLRRSLDGGVHWSNAIRVNGDSTGNGKQQWFPSISVDPMYGNIGISYFSMDTTGFLTSRYIAVSEDGGDNWQRVRVSNSHFIPLTQEGTLGNAVQTASYGRTVWTVWSDDHLAVHMARLRYTTTGVSDEMGGVAASFRLHQNYPNPFNPVTTIGFDLAKAGHVTLKVFDMLGEEVSLLVNEEKSVGTHRVQFDAGGLASGVYICRMQAGGYTDTKKLVLVR